MIMNVFAKKIEDITTKSTDALKKNRFADLDEVVDTDAFLPKYKRQPQALGREKVLYRKEQRIKFREDIRANKLNLGNHTYGASRVDEARSDEND